MASTDTDTHEHPPIPDRVAEGVALFDRYYRLNGWYKPGRFTPDSPDGTPPGISAITEALQATDVPASVRPDDPRRIRRGDGESYAQSPHLGMVPYLCCEDPAEVQPLLDAEWIRATVQHRDDAKIAAAYVAGLPDMVPALAAGLGLPAPRLGVVMPPQRPTWWTGARCVSCGTGQWTGTTRCHRCKADQPGVAWWQNPDTGEVTSDATPVRVVTGVRDACPVPGCGCHLRNADGSCVWCATRPIASVAA